MRRRILIFCCLSGMVLAFVLVLPALRARATQPACGAWTVVSAPSPALIINTLTATAAIAPSDAWAVGYDDRHPGQTLTEHWDGTAWSIVQSPTVGTNQNYLFGVAAISAQDVWAVGTYFKDTRYGRIEQTLILHWNGYRWSIVPSPNLGRFDNRLNGIAAISSRDIWAVGMAYTGGTLPQRTLTLHWDGLKWRFVASANGPTPNNSLSAVTAISSKDIWAVGSTVSNTAPPQALILHWNGFLWSVVNNPNPGLGDVLSGVSHFSSGDVWAVGYTIIDQFGTSNTLVEHWDGTTWNVIQSPSPESQASLYAVAAVPGEQSLWSVGTMNDALQDGHTLAEFYCQ